MSLEGRGAVIGPGYVGLLLTVECWATRPKRLHALGRKHHLLYDLKLILALTLLIMSASSAERVRSASPMPREASTSE